MFRDVYIDYNSYPCESSVRQIEIAFNEVQAIHYTVQSVPSNLSHVDDDEYPNENVCNVHASISMFFYSFISYAVYNDRIPTDELQRRQTLDDSSIVEYLGNVHQSVFGL